MKNTITILLFTLFLHSPVFPSDLVDLGRGRPGDILYVHVAPDPVNVRNGNFYLPAQDLYLPCYGFPLEVYRSYNSVSSRNGPFGKGWTFNYDIQLNVDESKGLKIIEADGYVNEFSPLENDKGSFDQEIEKIVKAKKTEDIKYSGEPKGRGSAFYDEFKLKLQKDDDFLKRQKERYLPEESKVSKSGKYISHGRGTTKIEKLGAGYNRTSETGRSEEFDSKGLLKRIFDRNDNQITLSYNSKSRLDTVTDGCNQSLRFSYNGLGKITQVQDGAGRKWQYSYDSNDHLAQSTSASNEKISYAYDSRDRMTMITFSDGTKTEMTYDPKKGYVTQQSGPGKKVTKYEYGRDGGTRFALVTDNEGLKNRYDFIDSESKTIFTEKTGKKTITAFMACCGKPLSIKNEKGIGEEFRYDDKGNLTSKVDSQKKVTTFQYEPRFNQLSEIKAPEGTSTRFVYDGKGNVTFVSDNGGAHVKLTYERHGKIETMSNQKEETITFSYNPFSKPSRIEKTVKLKSVAALDISYDKNGEVLKVDEIPKDQNTIQNIKTTLKGFLELLKPAGIDFDI